MRSTLRATAIALLLMVGVRVAQAQSAPVKLAYINSQIVLDAAPGRPAAESLLAKARDGYLSQLQKLQDSAQKLLSNYQRDEAKLTPAAKEKAQKAIQDIEEDLQKKQQSFQQEWTAKQNEVMAPITDMVKKVLDDIRAEEGYAMILDNAPGSNIVSADKNLDITDRVVSRLRAESAKAKAEGGTKSGAPPAPAGVTRPSKPPKR